MKIVVIGGGVAGLGVALGCARAGHQVSIVERDNEVAPSDPRRAPDWQRRGIPHFFQPHAFLARGIKELRTSAPDVYDALLEAGAYEMELAHKMPPGAASPGDDDLRFLGCRRSVMEAVLRAKVLAEPKVEFKRGTTVRDLTWEEAGAPVPRATGVVTDEGPVAADLVIDAAGRSSPVSGWIVDAGGRAPHEESTDCGVVYYARYYRFRPGVARRDGPWLLGPRVELGYYELGTFWGDNETFSFVQMIHPDDRELRMLRHPEAFTTALRTIRPAAYLIDDDISQPITDVLPMGQLRNTWRSFMHEGRPIVGGLVSIGDALCHTNPRYAWGLSLSLSHAFLIARLTHEAVDADAVVAKFYQASESEARTVFEIASETDDARRRHWTEGGLDYRSAQGSLPLFLLYMFPVAGMFDREIFRAAIARLMLLGDPRRIEADDTLLARGATLLRDFFEKNPPQPQGLTRNELVELVVGRTPVS
jgi:2-polyprenyl-6-methoxyphenol hydroxylase-like FAD-dependent oxidoreductase